MVESDVLDYILIKSLYQRIHMRLIAEDVVLYMLANPHIKAQYENEKVYSRRTDKRTRSDCGK